MTGIVSWEQMIFIVSVLTAAIVGTAGVLAGVYALLNRERNEMNARISRLSERIFKEGDLLDRRVASLEIFHAGLVGVLKQMDEFRGEVKTDFDELRVERREDMARLHERLNILMDRITATRIIG